MSDLTSPRPQPDFYLTWAGLSLSGGPALHLWLALLAMAGPGWGYLQHEGPTPLDPGDQALILQGLDRLPDRSHTPGRAWSRWACVGQPDTPRW